MIVHGANRTQRRIPSIEDVTEALIGSATYGSIGQLKPNTQLVCVQGFLNYMQSSEIPTTIDDLTEGIRSGLVQLTSNRSVAAESFKILESKVTIILNDTIMKI